MFRSRDGAPSQVAADIVAGDRAIAAISSSIGAGLGGQTGNNGRLWITLKPFEDRDVTVQQVIARLSARRRPRSKA